MLALRKPSAGFGLEAVDVSEPGEPRPGELLVRVEAVGVCGSDVHIYEWTDGYDFMLPHLPVTLGHELAGRVAAAGADAGVPVGTRVAVLPAVACGTCPACRSGEPHACTRRRAVGLTMDGGFARFVKVPASNVLPLPEPIDAELGALIEPLAVAADAVLVGEVGLGDTVLVLGPGTIGQGLALMARAAGAGRVIVAGRADAPRFEVLRRLGFADTVDVADGPLAEQVLTMTGGVPVDVVLEATGHPPSITDALPVLKKGGVLVVAGIHPSSLTLPLTVFVRNRHQLRASHSSRRVTWDRVVRLVSANPEAFRAMITHRLPLARGIEGFELARQRAASKVMLMP
ncbi:MAG: alcohol dehydrogenase catalytic domain-containing protein [Hyphomicrobiaceae bacterium]|nr:alcohol dehydrogenase catalytic domain-containing protein [Hyphomicrobiaceae bacterium]